MSLSGASSKLSRNFLIQCRNSVLLCARREIHSRHPIPLTSNRFDTILHSPNKAAGQISLLHHFAFIECAFQRFGFSSSASPQPSEKENAQSGGGTEDSNAAAVETGSDTSQKEELASNSESQSNVPQTGRRRRRGTKRTAFSDSDSELELTRQDLVKLVAEKEALLHAKQEEIENMTDKVLRTYAEMENVTGRTRREAENTKKFAIQNFAKGLLDVADNLSRASSVVKGSFAKIDESKDTVGAVPLLKTLLEGVEMTEKQLVEVFKKYGVENFDPSNEQFDPNRHNAVFRVPDASKPPGTIAVVLKVGYMLHDRILRPAQVGVTDAVDNIGADKSPEA